MRVIVAEKPSVARDLARVLGAREKRDGYLEGNGLRITWCRGHMAELEEPAHYDGAWRKWSLESLPMLPEVFAIRMRKGVGDQVKILRALLRDRDVEVVINACDAGREGELIFRWLMELVDCRKPVLRLWTSSLTDEAIRDAWSRLRPGSDLDRLGDAARCRAEADWLVGLNATRALTVLGRDAGGGELLSVGRVQTPTLAMIVNRDREIAAFVPETYWTVKATFRSPAAPGAWDARWFDPGGQDAPAAPNGETEVDGEVAPTSERVPDRARAEAIAGAARGQLGAVSVADRRTTREKPPLLYDLTSLQRRANQRYGLSASDTLELAQALYERHKLITYPRTDARFLTPDQVPGLTAIVAGLQPIPPYAAAAAKILSAPIRPGKRVVNAEEVGDHHAILPTGRTPDADRLTPDEKRVFDLVARRLLAALGDDAVFDQTLLVVAVPPKQPLPEARGGKLLFRARGRVCREAGWRAIDPPGPSRDVDLPAVEVGDPATGDPVQVQEGQTRPPRPYSDATLLRAMETAGRAIGDEELARQMRACGLGTPATRAAILSTLIERKYVLRKGRELRATDRGCAVIDAVPIDALKSAELTGRWEGRLTEIADGKGQRAAFLGDVRGYVGEVVDALKGAPRLAASAVQSAPIATCPGCGTPVRARGRGWACDSGCGFSVPGAIAKRELSDRMVKELCRAGRTEPVKGFKSKAGKPFSAGLRWDAEAKKVALWFPDDRRPPSEDPAPRPPPEKPVAEKPAAKKLAPLPPAAKAPAEGDPCPKCGQGRLIRGKAALGCGRWREGCDWRGPLPG